jgi:hypothetical protein
VTSSATLDIWETIARDAARESSIWREVLDRDARPEPVFSPLGDGQFALGLETIYEGYLVHYGTPRLFLPPDPDTALLLGDYLYAHGLVRIADFGNVDAVSDLSELISLCSQLRAENADGDGALWAATAALLGSRELDAPRTELRLHGDPAPLDAAARDAAGDGAVDRAIAAHAGRVR